MIDSQQDTDTALNSEKEPDGNQLFPVFLKLNQLHTVLVGAGNVGLEKLTALLNNSPYASITIVADKVSSEVKQLAADYPQITIHEKFFEDDDLNVADIVVAATGDNELNVRIRQAARKRKLLINVADKPDLCDFYLGSIVKKGDLKIGISTNGKSPTVAKRLKEVLNTALPDDINTTLQQISALRNTLSGDFASKVKALNKATEVLSPSGKLSFYQKNKTKLIAAGLILVLLLIAFVIYQQAVAW
ncbi:bifunctional precorrin-2 dehydrogenase/sirohydrochlorin ferrochelatase [Mucilaginibacter sp. Bleaf8]|uniref:precorrin-2 dehydrogenase/sirohydrochlorin ferrochelatase family protein n=1 Tax=Mucilaginibacter sp. Bleaf8 TaxID=2834430 RepID=UPI001BD0A9AA|nr:bifunctional precorrin-2 dehydrogenase/sirohydrochlorin ferrochelatase [Mucilaginibacter sp. Bleaf8]MBS7563922.1 bifunctional precorrin-2 dehydrogenase/sirohydrochlorin ferrochelatase [Mucilaginibacter sp. Bleaf8]